MDSPQDGMKIFRNFRARVNATIKRPSTNASTEVCTFPSMAVLVQYFREDTDGPSAGPAPAARRPRTDSPQAPPPPNEHKAVGWGGWQRRRVTQKQKKMAAGYVTGHRR